MPIVDESSGLDGFAENGGVPILRSYGIGYCALAPQDADVIVKNGFGDALTARRLAKGLCFFEDQPSPGAFAAVADAKRVQQSLTPVVVSARVRATKVFDIVDNEHNQVYFNNAQRWLKDRLVDAGHEPQDITLNVVLRTIAEDTTCQAIRLKLGMPYDMPSQIAITVFDKKCISEAEKLTETL